MNKFLFVCPFLLSSLAPAIELTFDDSTIFDFASVDQNYGDRVTSLIDGNLSYGAAGGFTPNVVVDYPSPDPSLWTTGFGDLVNVLFENTDSTGVLEIVLNADPGFEVALQSFDLADFSSTDSIVQVVEVTAESGSLFSVIDQAISSSTSTSFDFSANPLTAPSLTITVDARNLGTNNDNIGIDNIVFSQVAVPEPSSALMLLFGGATLLRRRR